MATETKTSRVASYDFTLINPDDPTDTKKRSVSFDLPQSTTDEQVQSAASLFAAASLSSVFQPTSWRDSEGVLEAYKMTLIEPSVTDKTVKKFDNIVPTAPTAQENP